MTKHSKAIAIATLSVLAFISALLLWKDDNSLLSELEHVATPTDELFQRQLALSGSKSPITAFVQQCKDGPPTFRPRTTSELDFLQQIHECMQHLQMMEPQIHQYPPQFEAKIPMLTCDEEIGVMNQLEFVQSTIKTYQRIWFVGDSILYQQFNSLRCMFNPSSRLLMNPLYRFDHSSNSTSILDQDYEGQPHSPHDLNQSDHSSTTIKYVSWGWIFDHAEAPLYKTPFPSILQKATMNDAIILDGGAHYDHTRMHLMENALKYIAQQSLETNATVYYIEPTPEEWNTSNGMYGRIKGNGCVKLTKEQLLGQEENTKGGSKLPPATWRSDLARLIFANAKNNNHKVNFVPTFWQLVATNQTSNRHEADCTHKSLSAVYLMNLQLMRAVMDNEYSREQAITENQRPFE